MRLSKTKVLGAAIAAVASGSTATAIVALTSGTAGAAQAYPVCVGVATNGTILGNHAVGPVCALNLPATRCTTLSAGLPQAGATVYACLPD
jgi:hypothetical protein